MAKVDYWGIGLMLIGVALALWVGKLVGAICGIVGLALIVWAECSKRKKQPKDSETAPRLPGARAEDQLRFVLEVAGTPPLRSNTDWKFLLTNCGARSARYVKLSTIRSEIGAYEILFKEIPVLHAGQQAPVDYEVIGRRSDDRRTNRQSTLWDFALDNAGERRATYFWYDISIQYRDTGELVRDGGIVGVCFDLRDEKLKTGGADYRQTS